MASIENEDDLESYQDTLGNVWSSATIRLSLVEVEDRTIPNGEIIFHRESRAQETTVQYSIEDFEIYEETVSDPFETVWGLFHSDLQVNDKPIDSDFRHFDGNTSTFFQTGVEESRVFDDRPRAELNTVFKPELSDELQDTYQDTVSDIDDRIKTADEPFFDLAKCEYYYFDHHFRGKSNAKPMVLVFADPGIRFTVDDDNKLELQFPVELADKTTIITYPQRPHGERKGWKTPMEDQEFEEVSTGLAN
jgi:hypothetical protein